MGQQMCMRSVIFRKAILQRYQQHFHFLEANLRTVIDITKNISGYSTVDDYWPIYSAYIYV